MPARAVEKEAEDLMEEIRDRQPLAALANGAEDTSQFREYPRAPQIPGKEDQTGATGQPIACLTERMNDGIAGRLNSRHIDPSPFGLSAAKAAC
jgi:hypothetical protein